MKDMHNNITVLHAITPQAVGTTGAANGKTSGIIDRQGFESIEFVFSSGASATVADTITPVIKEAAATGDSFTSVADGDLLGDETALTLTSAKSGRIGYRGSKRYLKIQLYGIGTATAIVSAVAIGGHPHQAPVA
jgi:hypothetical protein